MQKNIIYTFFSSGKQMMYLIANFLLILFTDAIVYLTGGTQSAFTHFMYIPIIMAAFLWDSKAASAIAVIGGVSLGPFMYRNVAEGIVQEPKEWIFRMVIFTGIAIIIGVLFQRIKVYKKKEIDKVFFNEMTGLPNANQLKLDLHRMIKKKKNFSLVAFQITNMDHINRSIDYKIGEKSLEKAIDLFSDFSNSNRIYYIYTNEFAVIMPQCILEDAYIKGLNFLEYFKEPVSIEGFLIEMVLKGGLVNFPQHSCEPNVLFKKMELALNEASNPFDLCVYDAETETRSKEKYEIQASLHDAIKNDQFYLVYQPKISLHENSVIGVEALLRWEHPQKGFISPAQFIMIAEDIGMINEITEWVIEKTIVQLKQWQEQGIAITVAINLSSKDLKNNSLIEFMKHCVRENEIKPQMIECEITERGVIKNLDFVKYLLNDARNFGFKISIDDFGTGYNSLMNLIKLPIDYLKIDKFFIDRIKEVDNQVALKNIIDMAHNLEIEVIAEGVEKKEQWEWLKEKGCDYIQGYYCSKPLLPDELTQYILSREGLKFIEDY